MKIEINIPALEGIVPAINSLATAISGQAAPAVIETPPAPAVIETPPAPKKKAAKKKTAKVVEAEEVEETPEVPAIEVADLVTKAKKLCEVCGGTQKVLRATLDAAGIKGEKLSTCDASFYPAIDEALDAAIAENDI
jgi:hypothetical protein